MFLLPKGSPLFENLAVSKLKLPDVLTKLSNGAFTGYASFVFQSSTAILVFEAGKLVSAIVKWQDGKRESGFEALSALAELMVSTGSGFMNVYKLSRDLTMCINALLEGEILYKAQELKLIDIKTLLEKIKDDKMNGCLRIYTDEHSAMIFYKAGSPLGFFHDGSSDIETSSNESQKIAGLPGAKIDLFSTKSADELMGMDLLEVANIQKIWDSCVAQQKSEIDKTNHERQERDKKVVSQKLAELEERVKSIAGEYAGKVGRSIVDKEISDNGGNLCLVDAAGIEKFMKDVERAAKLLVSGRNIKLMMEELNSAISVAKSEYDQIK
ncbi:MAG: GTPase-activating protein [Desulfuromonadaceae bacterium]|nr:GTPase-activating protein [Desulfuromonadaceae bacterium]